MRFFYDVFLCLQEIEATKSGLSLAKEQLKRVDEKFKAAVR